MIKMAGQGGFEPPDGGTKTRCLSRLATAQLYNVAEREGFEPSVGYKPTHA